MTIWGAESEDMEHNIVNAFLSSFHFFALLQTSTVIGDGLLQRGSSQDAML